MITKPIGHHRRSIRLKDYDYAQEGLYFVTICSHQRQLLFGEIVDDEMMPNELGHTVISCWNKIPEFFPHVKSALFVVMPNHVHGVIVINDCAANAKNLLHGTSQTIGSIVRGFKAGVTKWARQNTTIVTVWQSNYYEHIIRDEIEYDRIYEYITNNPLQWSLDYLNPECKNSKILPF